MVVAEEVVGSVWQGLDKQFVDVKIVQESGGKYYEGRKGGGEDWGKSW